MLIWIIQCIILSVIFILILHNLICYFKDTLTIPKIKDLILSPSLKYEHIYNIISNPDIQTKRDIDTITVPSKLPDGTDIDELNNNTKLYQNNDDDTISSMKNELKSFLKSQLTVKTSETEPQYVDSVSSYSTF